MKKEDALKLSIEMLSPDHREYTEDIHKNFIDIVYYDFEEEYTKYMNHMLMATNRNKFLKNEINMLKKELEYD